MVVWHWTYGKKRLHEEKNYCRHFLDYIFLSAARDFSYCPSNRKDSMHHLSFISYGTLAVKFLQWSKKKIYKNSIPMYAESTLHNQKDMASLSQMT